MKEQWTFFLTGGLVLVLLSTAAKATKQHADMKPIKTESHVIAYTDSLELTLYLDENRFGIAPISEGLFEPRLENAVIRIVEDGWEAETAEGSWFVGKDGKVSFSF